MPFEANFPEYQDFIVAARLGVLYTKYI